MFRTRTSNFCQHNRFESSGPSQREKNKSASAIDKQSEIVGGGGLGSDGEILLSRWGLLNIGCRYVGWYDRIL